MLQHYILDYAGERLLPQYIEDVSTYINNAHSKYLNGADVSVYLHAYVDKDDDKLEQFCNQINI